MIKLIASDMDETLLNEYDEIDKETFSIIKNLKGKKYCLWQPAAANTITC